MSGNNAGLQAALSTPQIFKIEVIIDRIVIEKGPHKNYIAPKPDRVESSQPITRSRSSSRGSKKSKKSKSGSRASKSPKKKSKDGKSGSVTPKGKKGKASKSGSATPKGKKGKSSKSGSATPKGKKGKKSKSGSASPRGRKAKKPIRNTEKTALAEPEEKLEGNRKEFPPLRVGIDMLNLKDVFVTQIDVEREVIDDTDVINELSTDEETEAGTEVNTVPPTAPVTVANEGDEDVEGPVDPVKLREALVKVQQQEKKFGKRLTKRLSDTEVPKSRRSSRTSSGASKGSKKKKSKKDAKKEKGKQGKGKAAKKKKPNYIMKKIPDPDDRPPSRFKDTWSLASERAFKRGLAIIFTETPAGLIRAMMGSYATLKVDRYGGKNHNDGASDPVGYLRLKFPSSWSDAIVQANSVESPAKELPVSRRLSIKNPLMDEQDQEIGFVSLEMAIYCYKDSIMTPISPSESTLYDILKSNAIEALTKNSAICTVKQAIPQYFDLHPRAKKMNYAKLINI